MSKFDFSKLGSIISLDFEVVSISVSRGLHCLSDDHFTEINYSLAPVSCNVEDQILTLTEYFSDNQEVTDDE